MDQHGKVRRVQAPPGLPSLEALAAASERLTGRPPTEEEMEKARQILARVASRRTSADASGSVPTGSSDETP